MSLLRSRRAWLYAIVGAFILFNLARHAWHFRYEVNVFRARGWNNDIAVIESRLADVIPYLPARGQVGYLKPDFSRADAIELARFFQTQYTLVPRILIVSTAPDVVIALTAENGAVAAVPAGFRLTKSFADGVALYERAR